MLNALLLILAVIAPSPQTGTLPEEVMAVIERDYRSYKMASVPPHVERLFQGGRSPTWCEGDFDGNGEADFAVLLEAKKNSERRVVIAFLQAAGAFRHVFAGMGMDAIETIPAGTRDFDYGTNREFIYRRDAVFTFVSEKGGVSLVYEEGRFLELVTSD